MIGEMAEAHLVLKAFSAKAVSLFSLFFPEIYSGLPLVRRGNPRFLTRRRAK
jgi:hypothetical protein